MDKKDQLWKIVEEFISKHEIRCEEQVFQTDRIIENAYELMADMFNVVGYLPDEEGEDDA